jgi:hypothetical protein
MAKFPVLELGYDVPILFYRSQAESIAIACLFTGFP